MKNSVQIAYRKIIDQKLIMKWNAFAFLSILILAATSCDKSETNEAADNIVFTEINKTIVASGIDSIPGTCKYLLFELAENGQSQHHASLSMNSQLILCDGYSSVLADTLSGKVSVLDDQALISADAAWAGVLDLSLEDFAGKGEKYIAYRSCFFPDGVSKYHFGWIKIRVSSQSDSLFILNRADNHTNGKAILAGQTE